ncbi:uncharacterized protein LOC121110597 [Gallus gallus]|uniref:uncharacterized protein LOC121110597 n=1 Tax=Gallus gallus TaxID=9031 RepID=UPI001AE91C48|nr:uncharacterized protein LOC121110597 [Gallus gallus]XP_046796547.1 uncharacterized protein LOC121110597 [Gallus gallus]
MHTASRHPAGGNGNRSGRQRSPGQRPERRGLRCLGEHGVGLRGRLKCLSTEAMRGKPTFFHLHYADISKSKLCRTLLFLGGRYETRHQLLTIPFSRYQRNREFARALTNPHIPVTCRAAHTQQQPLSPQR